MDNPILQYGVANNEIRGYFLNINLWDSEKISENFYIFPLKLFEKIVYRNTFPEPDEQSGKYERRYYQ